MTKRNTKKTTPENSIVSPIQNDIEAKIVAIDSIEIVDNYRKIFNDEKIKELSSNILENGLIHSILLRNLANGRFQLVSGERRLRASILAGLTSIKATIRDLTDEQVLDLQLSENLQRDDVSPLEEASAYLIHIERGLNVKEICHRIDKSASYVAGRLSLHDLIVELQEFLMDGSLPLGQAIYLSRQEPISQKLYFDQLGQFNSVVIGDFKKLKSFFESKVETLLSTAIFDLKTDGLIDNVIACSSCKKNTGNNFSLFSDKITPTCIDKQCFKAKTLAWRKLFLLGIPADIHLIQDTYNFSWADQPLIEELREVVTIYDRSIIDEIIELPENNFEKPNPDDYEAGDSDVEYFQHESLYLDDQRIYKESIIDYNNEISQPNIVKGIFISASDIDQIFYFKRAQVKNSSGSAISSNEAQQNQVVQILQEEKEKLVKKFDRSLVLDAEKIHKQQMQKLKELDFYNRSVTSPLTACLNDAEQDAILIMLYLKMSWESKNEFKKLFELNNGENLYEQLIGLPQHGKCYIFRQALLNNIFWESTTNVEYKAVSNIANSYRDEIGLTLIIETQDAIRTKREVKFKERLYTIDVSIKAEIDKVQVLDSLTADIKEDQRFEIIDNMAIA